jgi:asparagine synthase (glutamine-hydrolysing)
MCGIAGAVGFAEPGALQEMSRRMAHRGPDDAGHWLDVASDPPVMMASRRLAILDLSFAGHMPMLSADGALVVTHNGEIYNYREIRERLRGLGHEFRSNTDTEVILRAFVQWGPECLPHFNGMFAFAIWDRGSRQLFLARDRLGVKPLYYTWQGSRLLFASEIKSILAARHHAAEMNREALATFLKYQFVPWPDTLFRGIRKLEPAHYAIFSQGELTVRRYWQPPAPQDAHVPSGDELAALVDDAVKIRLVSDVPVGIFLSGGVDSSLVAAIATRHRRALASYTVTFTEGGNRYDESEAARSVADYLGLQNHEVSCNGLEGAERLPDLIWYLDEPVAENLIYPSFALCRAARKLFTVALSGEGADEVFFGYRYYTLEAMRRRFAGFVPGLARRAARSLFDRIEISDHPQRRAMAYLAAESSEDAFHAWAGAFFSPRQLSELITPDWYAPSRAVTEMRQRLPSIPLRDGVGLSPFYDLHFRMVDYILSVKDKMSMSVGLEIRSPFMDYRLVEASFGLPAERKIRGSETKIALREVAARVLPERTALRRKVPFSSPSHLWMTPLTDRFLRPSELVRDGILNAGPLHRWTRSDAKGRALHSNKLWSLIVLEIWYRMFVSCSLEPRLEPLAEKVALQPALSGDLSPR